MLYEIMKTIRNFFPSAESVTGSFEVTGNTVGLASVSDGQYYMIEGSVFNDGVHKNGSDVLTHETFYGSITPLAIPSDFLSLVDEIEEWQTANGSPSAYKSESFGGYSYTKDAGAHGAYTWREAFAGRLNAWRKL